ncbi:flagellar protein f [Halogeometricum borinquense DSM 11551]|uniref:Flagellar protein f n=1 Tax=Halogeometricum borinquense (strain ATCC 700274 / DSM 11551 / JCM 10706 / KCTC 4070 / PR3) TaxID=469382 RepID=E4NP51_HALBP|nr:flagellar protein f [Halogeometricum borinquense]ADQ67592.1 putative archaeal flagellar protein F [Halogeometricum borinquense DSM 11551]ELY23727.1 flagellar protein f [Halogeometricum borinquense DSM 11551]
MGFGVSGSTAIIFLGVLIATGTLYTTVSDTTEMLNDAEDSNSEHLLERRNTGINVTSVTYSNNSGTYPMDIRVKNTGTLTLSANDTSVLVNNEYQQPSGSTRTVDGTSGTDIWAPNETLLIELTVDNEPKRVKIVTENGVTDSNSTLEEV